MGIRWHKFLFVLTEDLHIKSFIANLLMKIRLLLVKNSCIYLHNSSFHCDINAFLPKYYKEQRNAVLIILCYTSLCHNEL